MSLMQRRYWLGRRDPDPAEVVDRGGGRSDGLADARSDGQGDGLSAGVQPVTSTLNGAAAAVLQPREWSQSRLQVAESLWGEGFVSPVGANEVMRLARPLGLSAASSVLLLGAGAGGPAWLLAEQFDAWVSGYESDPALAALAGRRLEHGAIATAKRATVRTWNPAAPLFRRQGFHHAMSLDAIRDARVEEVIGALVLAVRPGGQIVLLETIADRSFNAADPAVTEWCRLERREPNLPTQDGIDKIFQHLGCDVNVVEDVSKRHVQEAIAGWQKLVSGLAKNRPEPGRAALIVAEAEMWLRRLNLVQAGVLRLARWHASRRLSGST
jgi:cyclopropane fatty-acyl-phospholipid synthase-like methyltransferase